MAASLESCPPGSSSRDLVFTRPVAIVGSQVTRDPDKLMSPTIDIAFTFPQAFYVPRAITGRRERPSDCMKEEALISMPATKVSFATSLGTPSCYFFSFPLDEHK